ncbi:preprotein translocase subunit SecG [mine drainage metagenome]|uniref:Preprotein translocase subunit SecG n=1 Tax=mine drainage metagenome TaxID=410659 RepID=A0A1J5T2G6_9ZZZZ
MTILFVILIVIACVVLGFIVLVQNPKGGGLAGSVGGFSNQIMGVKQTTDVLEKGTWLFAIIIALLSVFSTLIFKGSTKGPDTSILQKVNTSSNTAPVQTTPPNTVPATQQKK